MKKTILSSFILLTALFINFNNTTQAESVPGMDGIFTIETLTVCENIYSFTTTEEVCSGTLPVFTIGPDCSAVPDPFGTELDLDFFIYAPGGVQQQAPAGYDPMGGLLVDNNFPPSNTDLLLDGGVGETWNGTICADHMGNNALTNNSCEPIVITYFVLPWDRSFDSDGDGSFGEYNQTAPDACPILRYDITVYPSFNTIVTDNGCEIFVELVTGDGTACSTETYTCSVAGDSFSYDFSNGINTPLDCFSLYGTVTCTGCNTCEDLSAAITTTPPECSDNTQAYLDSLTYEFLPVPNNNGTATVAVDGGEGAYEYLWSNGDTSPTATNLNSGPVSITVTDVTTGCVVISSSVVDTIPPLELNIISVIDATCGQSNGSVTVEYSGGNGAPYAIFLGENGISDTLSGPGTFTIDNLSPGSHVVSVCDGGWCFVGTIVEIGDVAPFTAQMFTESPTCSNNTDGYFNTGNPPPTEDGSAMLVISGGTAPFSYQWSNGSTQSSSDNLPSGPISVTITDATGCPILVEGMVEEVPPIEVVYTVTDVSCNGLADGAIAIDFSGGNGGGYVLFLDGAIIPGSYTAGTYVFDGLEAGIYEVVVCDEAGCWIVVTIEVIESPELDIEIITTPPTCSSNSEGYGDVNNPAPALVSDGTAEVSVVGGTPPYLYFWNTADTTSLIGGLSPGTVTVTVTDANGCTATAEAEVEDLPPLYATLLEANNPSCPGESDGSITIEYGGGNGPVFTIWLNGTLVTGLLNTDGTYTFDNLPAGTYEIAVCDNNLCIIYLTVTLEDPQGLSIVTVTNSPTCPDNADAQWDINTPPPTDDGSAIVTVSGGMPPYNYQWSNGDTLATTEGLSAGVYTVTVTDANDCIATAEVEVEEVEPLYGTITATDLSCNGYSDGTITIDYGGGNGGGFILIVNGNSYPVGGAGTYTIEDLPAGTYEIIVCDIAGCILVLTAEIEEAPVLEVEIVTTRPTCSSNSDGYGSVNNPDPAPVSDGTAEALVVGGTPPYAYYWNTADTTSLIGGLSPGTVTVTVTDANGCTATAEAEVEDLPPLYITPVDIVDPFCNGDSTGSITVEYGGGNGFGFVFWLNGALGGGMFNNDGTYTFDNLPAGEYEIALCDIRFCIIYLTVTLEEPEGLYIEATADSPTCPDNAIGLLDVNTPAPSDDGSVSVDSISGGTAPYTILWSTGDTTATVTDLSPGIYTVTVTDDNDCTVTSEVEVEELEDIYGTVSSTDASCGSTADGTITVEYGGGNGGGFIIIVNGTPYSDAAGAGTYSFEDLAAGTYEIIVCDINGCIIVLTAEIGESSTLEQEATLYQPACPGDEGIIDLTVWGGEAPYSFEWSNGATTEDIFDVPEGIYTVTITDSEACSTTATYELTAPEPINISFECIDLGNGEMEVVGTVTGGTPPYSYLWLPMGENGTSVIAQVEDSVCYTLKVADANGCNAVASDCCYIEEDAGGDFNDPFGVFPNPVIEILNVDRGGRGTGEEVTFEIITIDGKVAKRFPPVKGDMEIIQLSVTDLPSGAYILLINTGKEQVTRKVIIANENSGFRN